MKQLTKKIAIENDIPQDGERAFAEGWDVTACPFNYDPPRQRWIDEWNAAALTTFEQWQEDQ